MVAQATPLTAAPGDRGGDCGCSFGGILDDGGPASSLKRHSYERSRLWCLPDGNNKASS